MSLTSLANFSPNCKCFHAVTHVIFDLDGTLVDTESINHAVWQNLFESHQKSLPDDFIYRFRGAPMLHTLQKLIKELEIDATVEEMSEKLRNIEEKIFTDTPCDLTKGSARLIKHFNRHLVPMAIGTSSRRFQVELKMKRHEKLFNMIHHVVTSDDVKEGKPAPDIYRLAARKFPARPKNSSCLTFEDTANGLKSAIAAGMQCVFVPQIEVDKKLKELATVTINSLEDFEPELFGLPPLGKRKALKYIVK